MSVRRGPASSPETYDFETYDYYPNKSYETYIENYRLTHNEGDQPLDLDSPVESEAQDEAEDQATYDYDSLDVDVDRLSRRGDPSEC